ncbi:hypothetical protein HN587_04865 [Candidatus Woesearchaeota archaeon]|jgi:opine dehydrogenase|nr:hypothetical protein [Candidatus Woesearchaeota archaeon]
MNEKILICGAGQGGHAIAGYAATLGNEVSLYTHTPKKAEIISSNGNKIKLTGILDGEAQLRSITTNLQEAVSDNKYIFIITDATVHKYYAERLAPILTDQQVMLISPGIGGALEFLNLVNSINPDANIGVSETDTLVYACKVPEIGTSYIKTEKKSIIYSSVPNAEGIAGLLNELYPQFEDVGNPLMGLDDSPVFHIVGMLYNAHRILNKEDFNFYIGGTTEESAEIMEEMDAERCEVARAVGIEPRTVREWLNIAYGVEMSSLFNMIHATPPYQNTPEIPNRSPAPKTLFHRYLLEEIPLRAVPTVSIARIFDIPTPRYEEMVGRARELTGIDFWKTGRTLEDMGLTEQDIKRWTNSHTWR